MEFLKLNFFKRKGKNEEEITNFKKRQVKVLKFSFLLFIYSLKRITELCFS